MLRQVIGIIAILVAWIIGCAGARAEVSIMISCSSLGIEMELCRSGAQAWADQAGATVNFVSTPADANERLALYQSLLAAGSSDIDVFQIDVVWPGMLASHFIDLRPYFSEPDLADHFETLIQNNTVDGSLIAIPWFADAGLLYYRRDLLEQYGKDVPSTWEQLTATAQEIQDAERAAGNDHMQGFVFQARTYEGLTCNALEWIASYGGGTIVDEMGNITVNNAQAIEALSLAESWIGRIAPQGVLNYSEEDARGVFQSGNAVFMRNWPYAWALVNEADSPVRDLVGVGILPKGTGQQSRNAAVLGGQQLAVSRYSEHPEEAADLVRYLTSTAEQKRRAVEGSFNPTRRSVYADADVIAEDPLLEEFLVVLENAVARPSSVTGEAYNRVSDAFVQAVHATLSGRRGAGQSLDALEATLERMKSRGRW